MKKKENTANDVVYLQDIIDNLNEKIKTLESRIANLQEQLETAYSVNNGLLAEQQGEEDYDTLTKMHTLLLVFMALTKGYTKNSELGRLIEDAIDNYYIDMAKALAKRTDFSFSRRKKEDESTDNCDEDFGDEGEEY